MLKRKLLMVATSTIFFILGGCECSSCRRKQNNQSQVDEYTVSKEKFNELFDLENIALHSNYKISVVVPSNDWDATISFDNGKMYITNIGLRQPAEEDPVEQKDYEYIVVNSIVDGVMNYDEYYYWGEWTLREQEYGLAEFFQGYGIFSFNYDDFTYNKNSKEYVSTIPPSEYDESMFGGMEVRIHFLNNRITRMKYIRSYEDESLEMIYTFSDYGSVSFELPVVE